MKKHWTLLLFICVTNALLAQADFVVLQKELDKTLANSSLYLKRKNTSINQLKKTLRSTSSNDIRYGVYEQLYNEYKSYQSDSALVYARKSLQIAYKNHDTSQINKARINFASILGTVGMYKEAIDVLNQVEKTITPELKGDFYWAKRDIYHGLTDYAIYSEEKNRYINLRQKYRDSAIVYLPVQSALYLIEKSERLIAERKYNQAIDLLLPIFDKTPKTDSNRAIIAYLISENYALKKDKELQKKWLTLSAISDLELVTKENVSLRKLAFILYEEGDIETAYQYTKRSLDDAVFYNSKRRTYEISKMLPVINEAYETKSQTNRSQLTVFLIFVSILSMFLLGVVILLFKQMKKLAKAQKSLSLANEKLNQTNIELAETSLLKEIYIGQYMDQCSIYIGKMEEYSQKLKVMATAGKINDLLSTVKSKAFIDKELKEFYAQFDQTFIQLFPTFVEEFKGLLRDPESIQLKKGELLNPELRIFALIRLGIKDSTKIAIFLRYSASTIYNYRYEIKNKSLGPREEFESKVLLIGTSNES
jgi:hypothetical protein